MNDIGEIVLVEWCDAYGGGSSEWVDYDDLSKDRPMLINEAIGRITSRQGGMITIVPHQTDPKHRLAKHTGTGEMDIPEVCVVRIWRLRKDDLL